MENDDKNIIDNVIRRKDDLKKKKSDLGNIFLPTGMPRVIIDKYYMTRVATKNPLQRQQDEIVNYHVKRKTLKR